VTFVIEVSVLILLRYSTILNDFHLSTQIIIKYFYFPIY